jgi:hypothetical protein
MSALAAGQARRASSARDCRTADTRRFFMRMPPKEAGMNALAAGQARRASSARDCRTADTRDSIMRDHVKEAIA